MEENFERPQDTHLRFIPKSEGAGMVVSPYMGDILFQAPGEYRCSGKAWRKVSDKDADVATGSEAGVT